MSERAAASGWLATAAVVLAAGALFALLHQRAMHGEDTRLFVLWLAAGPDGDVGALPRHFLFLPLLHAFGELLRPLGASWFTVLWLAASLGSALGLGACHRAARTLVPAGASALWLPLALLVVPTWFFFATAAEIHGVFVLPMGLAWWALARFVQRPNVAAAALVGLASGTAAALHFTGHFLLPTLWLAALAQAPRTWRALLGHGTAMACGHAAAVASIALALGLSPIVQFTAATSFAGSWTKVFAASEVPAVVWEELLAPYVPWSLLLVLALRKPAARPWALVALGALLLHAPLPVSILSHAGHLHEHGAYAMAFAVPAVLAALHALPRRAFVAALVVSTALALWLQAPRLVRAYDPEFVVGLQELRAQRGPVTLLVGSFSSDMEALTIGAEDQLYVDSDKIKAWVDYGGSVPLPQWFDAMVAALTAGSGPLFVCASARERLQRYPNADIQALWAGHVERAYTVEEVRQRGLHGWLLLPRAK